MATARSFSYSCPASALQSAYGTAHRTWFARERSPDYEVLEAHPDSEDPDPAEAYFPAAVDVVQLYFEDAIHNGNSPLLSHEQEIQLAKAIEAGHKAAMRLSSGRPTNGRTQALEDEVRKGQQAREHLITANLRLVVSVASWYRGSSIPLADLFDTIRKSFCNDYTDVRFGGYRIRFQFVYPIVGKRFCSFTLIKNGATFDAEFISNGLYNIRSFYSLPDLRNGIKWEHRRENLFNGQFLDFPL